MDAGDRMILARLNQLESYLRLRLDGQSDGPYDDAAPSMNTEDLTGNGNRADVNLRFEESVFNPFELPQVREIFSQTFHSQQLLDEELARGALQMGDSLSLDFHDNPATIQAFFDTINIWYACVNPLSWPITYQTAASGDFREGPESCLVLLVLALGKAGSAGDSPNSHEAAGMQYFSAAWSFFPSLVINQSLISLQCIILASVYLLYLTRPVEAWTLLSSITMKLQLHLANQATLAPEARKLLTRVVWNAILLESDILTELALPQSNLISHFPNLATPSPFLSHSDSNENDFAASLPRDDPWYLTANIDLYRLRMRVSETLYSSTTPTSLNTLEPLIMDLDASLSAWSSTYLDQSASVAGPIRNWLVFRYHAMRALIYRPVLHLTLSSYSTSSSSPPMGTANVITNGTVHTYPASARGMLHTSLDSSMGALEHFADWSSSHFPFAWQGELAVVRCAIMVTAARDERPPLPSHLPPAPINSSSSSSAPAAATASITTTTTIRSQTPKTNPEHHPPPALSSLLPASDHIDAVLMAVARELGAMARSGGIGIAGISGTGSSVSLSPARSPSPTAARAVAVMEDILAVSSLADGRGGEGGGGGGFR